MMFKFSIVPRNTMGYVVTLVTIILISAYFIFGVTIKSEDPLNPSQGQTILQLTIGE